MTKRVLILLVCGALLGLVGMPVQARLISADQHVQQVNQPDVKQTSLKGDGSQSPSRMVLPVGLAANPTVDSRGALIAQTWRDWQAHIAVGRSVAVNPTNLTTSKAAVHFSFTNQATSSAACRWAYGVYDAVSGTYPLPNGKVIVQENGPSSVQAGLYPRIMVDPDGKAIVTGVDFITNGDPATAQIQTSFDRNSMQGSFGNINGGSIVPDSLLTKYNLNPPMAGAARRAVYPRNAMTVTSTDTILYVATREQADTSSTANDQIFTMKVFRKVGKYAPGVDTNWQLVLIDSTGNATQEVATDPTSTRVVVAWTRYANGDRSEQTGDDLYYADSPTGLSGTWTLHNLTNIGPGDTYAPWYDMATFFDHTGKLHMVWTSSQLGVIYNKVVHWSEIEPSRVYTIYDATWAPVSGRGGSNVGNAGRLSISECEDRLYVVFSLWGAPAELEPADDYCDKGCSDFRYKGNGEIFLCVSKDLEGKGWDRPRNLTNSYTPKCDTGTCADDSWASLSLLSMDDADYVGTEKWTNAYTYDPSEGGYTGSKYLQLMYLTDRMPGYAMGGQNEPTLNDIRWIRLACAPPVVAAVLKATPSSVSFPEFTHPGVPKSYKIVLENTGNSDLTISSLTPIEDSVRGVSIHSNWMQTASAPSMIAEAGKDSMTLTLNAGGVITAGPTVCFGKLRFIYTPPEDTLDLAVQFTVADTVAYTEWDTLTTACIRLAVGTDGNVGHNYGDSAGLSVGKVNMDYISNPHGSFYECDTIGGTARGDARIYLGDGSPIVVRKVGSTLIGSWSAFAGGQPGTNFATANGFKPVTGAGYTPHGFVAGTYYDQFSSGTFVTIDSMVKLERTWYAPKHADSCNFIIERTRVFSANIASSVTGLMIGEMIDWDIPSDTGSSTTSLSGNLGGSDATRKLLYMRGYDIADTAVECAYNARRYAGLALLNWHMKSKACYDSLWGGSVIQNSVWQANSTGNLETDTLYKYMHASGIMVPASGASPADLSTFMTFKDGASGWTLQANDTLTIYTALATVRTAASTATGLDSLKLAIDKAKNFMKKTLGFCGSCCIGTRGNVNGIGIVDLSDLSALVSYLTGGGYVLPCFDAANVNGTGIVDLSDLSALVSYLTGGGYVLPPCS